MMRAVKRALCLFGACLAALACGKPPAAPASPTPVPSAVTPQAAWVPGLGELMLSQQARHAKLWLAGQAGNWELAAYEIGEMREGFGDIARLHPAPGDLPVPVDQAIETIMTSPLDDLAQAIQKKDRKTFEAAFDTMTQGCNSCHQATNHGFTVLERPKSSPFPNQDFQPPE
jgi:hypothetical protein